MAFSDPIKVKVDGTNEVECPRVSTGNFESTYLSSDGTIRIKVATANGKRKRHTFRIDLSKITTDPYDTDQNVEVSTSAYVVVDKPLAGFTNEELRKLTEGLKTILTEGNIKKLLASEN
jgi:hypothetical protein